MPCSTAYVLIPSTFGPIGLIWRGDAASPIVQRVLLPHEAMAAPATLHAGDPGLEARSCPAIDELAHAMQRFLASEPVAFALEGLALADCPAFQQRVLRADHAIPRGRVSTYGRIARHLGIPGGARAVGNALARNPFPVLIPCHRAIAADGRLGGYRGGLPMKRALLEMEGVEFSPQGTVANPCFHY